jgi:hypothetical protein
MPRSLDWAGSDDASSGGGRAARRAGGSAAGQPAGPPHPISEQVDGCRHDQGADHERVMEHAEGDDKGDLGEDEQRQHGQGAEGGGQDLWLEHSRRTSGNSQADHLHT